MTSTSYQFPGATVPRLARLLESAAGALFQVTVPSVQVLVATRKKIPPSRDPSRQYSLSFALRTVRVPTPETVNFKSVFRTGLLSAYNRLSEPKLVPGASDCTYVSAAGVNVRVVGGEGVVMGAIFEEPEVLPVESYAMI